MLNFQLLETEDCMWALFCPKPADRIFFRRVMKRRIDADAVVDDSLAKNFAIFMAFIDAVDGMLLLLISES